MRYKIIFLSISLIFSLTVYAQKEAQQWYFGNGFGFIFNDTSLVNPTPISNTGYPNGFENNANICDACTGESLFWTNGLEVRDSVASIMQGGNSLSGSSSSSDGVIIVPLPGNDSLYYIFIADDCCGDPNPYTGISYSMVNINANGGLGEVVFKDSLLDDSRNYLESVTAVHHANRSDIWVLFRDDEDKFYSFLVTKNGLDATATKVSTVDDISGLPANKRRGQIKISPNGSKVSMNVHDLQQVYDFDDVTGEVSNPLQLGSRKRGYGTNFSQDASKVYYSHEIMVAGDTTFITQFDLSLTNTVTIVASKVDLDTVVANFKGAKFTDIALGPNGKIYIHSFGSGSGLQSRRISVIHNPNQAGFGCNYIGQQIVLGPPGSGAATSSNFIQSYFSEQYISANGFLEANYTVPDTMLCEVDSLTIEASINSRVYKQRWEIKDSLNNLVYEDSAISTKFLLEEGTYYISLVIEDKCGIWSDTILDTMSIGLYDDPEYFVPSDTICDIKGRITLALSGNAEEYIWSTEETTETIEVTQAGVYSLEYIMDNGCSYYDTTFVEEENCQYLLFIPNAVRIRDSDSETFWNIRVDRFSKYSISIYDRWGSVIYNSMNNSSVKINMDNLENAVLTYKFEGIDLYGEEIRRVGNITLIKLD